MTPNVIDELRTITSKTVGFDLTAKDIGDLKALDLASDTLGGQVVDSLPDFGRSYIDVVDAEWILGAFDGTAETGVLQERLAEINEYVFADFDE